MDTAVQGACAGSPLLKKKLHFRILILDPDAGRTEALEKSFLAMYRGDGTLYGADELVVREDAQFFYVRNEQQLATLPGAGMFNSAWISLEYPGYFHVAKEIYRENPFCYQVFYGEEPGAQLLRLLRSRPIGLVKDVSEHQSVFAEMANIWRTAASEREVLRLESRASFCTVAYDTIVYCQSQGRKCYIHINAAACDSSMVQDDIFVRSADNHNELLAYVQNRKLDDLAGQLPGNRFVRIHQSYLVNKAYVTGIRRTKEGWLLVVSGPKNHVVELPVSERYRADAVGLFREL